MAGAESGFRVWIDQGECTADGSCYQNCPEVFAEGEDGIAYVRQGDVIFDGSSPEAPSSLMGVAEIASNDLDTVVEEAENCPGECIHIERSDAPL